MAIIYGVDTSKLIKPVMVREALISCFNEAHCTQTGLEAGAQMTKDYCLQIVKKAFVETGGDFDNPTKSSLGATLPWLAEFSKSFRNQSIIVKHMNEIMELISMLED